MAQVLMKEGLRMFGKKGVDAVTKKMCQLHDVKALEPVHGLIGE